MVLKYTLICVFTLICVIGTRIRREFTKNHIRSSTQALLNRTGPKTQLNVRELPATVYVYDQTYETKKENYYIIAIPHVRRSINF